MLNFICRGQLPHLIHSEVEEVDVTGSHMFAAVPLLKTPQLPQYTDLYESVAPSVGLNRYGLQS